METLNKGLTSYLISIKEFFRDSFISAYIFDYDGLPIASCLGDRITDFEEDAIGSLGISLMHTLDRFNREISEKELETTVVSNASFSYIFSEISGLCAMVLILRSTKDKYTLIKYGEEVSVQIQKIMENISDIGNDPHNSFSEEVQPLQSQLQSSHPSFENTEILHQIKRAVSTVNGIMARASRNSNMPRQILIKEELLDNNTLTNNLSLLNIGLKRLNNNFVIRWN